MMIPLTGKAWSVDAVRMGDVVPAVVSSCKRAFGRRIREKSKYAGRHWAVDWLVSKGVYVHDARALVHAVGRRIDIVQVIGALSGYRYWDGDSRRGVVGLMVTGARRTWERRVDPDEVKEIALYLTLWPNVVHL